MSFYVPEQFRIAYGTLTSAESGNNGAFRVKLKKGTRLLTIATDTGGWEHVSVSLKSRVPTWHEMCEVKSIFWDASDEVVQYHPAESEYVNLHENCLHLWRPNDGCLLKVPPELQRPAA